MCENNLRQRSQWNGHEYMTTRTVTIVCVPLGTSWSACSTNLKRKACWPIVGILSLRPAFLIRDDMKACFHGVRKQPAVIYDLIMYLMMFVIYGANRTVFQQLLQLHLKCMRWELLINELLWQLPPPLPRQPAQTDSFYCKWNTWKGGLHHSHLNISSSS